MQGRVAGDVPGIRVASRRDQGGDDVRPDIRPPTPGRRFVQRGPAIRVPCVHVHAGFHQNGDRGRVPARAGRHVQESRAEVVPGVHIRTGFETVRDLLGGRLEEEVSGAPILTVLLAGGGSRAEEEDGCDRNELLHLSTFVGSTGNRPEQATGGRPGPFRHRNAGQVSPQQ